MKITEIDSELPNMKPIKEVMNVFIDGVNRNIPCRNGFVTVFTGSGGSGKSSLLLNMFKNPKYYRNKFDNIYYFIPITSFSSVEKSPFAEHDKIYHDLTSEKLESIYSELIDLKMNALANNYPLESSLIIIDDFANALKDNEIAIALNEVIIKTRHLNCSWIITLQAYNLCPQVLRKQITNAIIFKPKNNKEWLSVGGELLNMKKDDLTTLYNYVFNEPYNHLDVDTVENQIYKNFNKLELN
jgi:energy-coupling factor transporter ATP-binding protein EcfA2